MKIAIAGCGYVGLSMAVLLAQHNEVVAYDISVGKVEDLNRKISPIKDADIEHYLKTQPLKLTLPPESGSHNEMHNLVYGRCYGKDKPGAVYAGI